MPLAFITGPFNVWGYFGFLISIAFLVSYIMTNAGMIRFMLMFGEFHWFRHGVLGVVGSLIFVYPLYKTVWPRADGIYGVLPFVYPGWIVLGVLFLLYTRSQRPGVLAAIGTSLADGDDIVVEPDTGRSPVGAAEEGPTDS